MAVQLPDNDADAASISFLSIFIATAITLLVPFILVFSQTFISITSDLQFTTYLLIAISLSIWLGATKASLDAYLLRKKHFSKAASGETIR